MTVTRVGAQQEKTERGRASSRRRARRLALTLGAPAVVASLVATALPAGAATPTQPAPEPLPGTASVVCESVAPKCVMRAIGGKSDAFLVSAFGGTQRSTLIGTVNSGSPFGCPRFDANGRDFVQVGFEDFDRGATWTKRIEIVGTPAPTPTAAAAVRAAKVCFQAPYRFFKRPGFELNSGPGQKGPYSGVLASCATVDSLFPTEFRSRLRPTPCVESVRAVNSGSNFVVIAMVRIPRGDAAAPRLRPNF